MAELKKDDRLMILLEGNIGAGKTTVGKALASSEAFDFIEEPTAAWREGFAANMLELFYSDTKRWAFTFQICAFITRAKTWKEVLAYTDHSRVVLERSVFCDRYIFAENCYRTGLMTAPEYQVYCGLWEFLVASSPIWSSTCARRPRCVWSASRCAIGWRKAASHWTIFSSSKVCTTNG